MLGAFNAVGVLLLGLGALQAQMDLRYDAILVIGLQHVAMGSEAEP